MISSCFAPSRCVERYSLFVPLYPDGAEYGVFTAFLACTAVMVHSASPVFSISMRTIFTRQKLFSTNAAMYDCFVSVDSASYGVNISCSSVGSQTFLPFGWNPTSLTSAGELQVPGMITDFCSTHKRSSFTPSTS